jgi:hypothetical protein
MIKKRLQEERGGEDLMSQNNEEGNRRKYRIDIGAYGSIGIEAPTKEECLELFKEVTRTKRESSLDQAIR